MQETTKVKGIIVLGRLLRSFVNSTGEWYSCASEVQLAARTVHGIAGPRYMKPTGWKSMPQNPGILLVHPDA